ncbi:MAG: amino acid adenylation domain-containing protein [Ruthenibacterium sp.]
MQISVLEYLERSAERLPQKAAFADESNTLSFARLLHCARAVGTVLIRQGAKTRTPIAVLTEKSALTVAGFLGAVYAGCFYVPLDVKHPSARLQTILQVLQPDILLVDEENRALAEALSFEGTIVFLEQAAQDTPDGVLLCAVREQATDLDPLYANFTSGSTGVPKGVVVGHRSVIDFIDQFTAIFSITQADVLGNQAPFDFDVSVKDIYSGLATGATVQLIPRAYFSQPVKLMDYLCERKPSTLIWAVSALCFVTTMQGLAYKTPQSVRQIIFSGEVMPIKHLNLWREFLPDARYVNVYGPTEITCNCFYYILDRAFSQGETLPLGRPFPNEKILLLDEQNRPVTEPGILGEICVCGTALALGYYNDFERTQASFVQNPLNKAYPERMYRTGDLARYQEDGSLVYASRKDFQIKHMGHRIELGEIETVLQTQAGVNRACCIYWPEKKRLLAFYDGVGEKSALLTALQAVLPPFMQPNAMVHQDVLPMTKNGKIDRQKLLADYQSTRERGRTR